MKEEEDKVEEDKMRKNTSIIITNFQNAILYHL